MHPTFHVGRRRNAAAAAVSLLIGLVVLACGGPSTTARPSASLVDLEFTPRPSAGASGSPGSPSANPSLVSWPVGWDVSFCTALTDATVAHELAIDIQRALDEDARADAEALTAELAQIAPISADEANLLRDWEPAAQVKADLIALAELHAAVATAYQAWFTEGGRPLLREARQARNQVARAVPDANVNLQSLADLGISCPGVALELETF